MSSDSDEEPDWLLEQTSARKEKLAATRFESSDDDFSNSVMESDGEDSPAAGDAAAGSGKSATANNGKKAAGSAGGTAKASSSKRAPPSSRLPLQLAPKVRRDCLLLEAHDPSLDLSGDFGCIGKLHVRKAGAAGASSSQADGPDAGSVAELRRTLMLDLKGKVYDADILPCNTMCLLAVDGSKAKIEAVFSDFVQLGAPRDSIFDTKEVVGGTREADARAEHSTTLTPLAPAPLYPTKLSCLASCPLCVALSPPRPTP